MSYDLITGFNQSLSNEEHDLLKLIEECSEVQHVLCKIIKYGWEYVPSAHYPDKKTALITELDDLKKAVINVEEILSRR